MASQTQGGGSRGKLKYTAQERRTRQNKINRIERELGMLLGLPETPGRRSHMEQLQRSLEHLRGRT